MADKRLKSITLRVGDDERAELEAAASTAGQSLSTYLRAMALQPKRRAPVPQAKPDPQPARVALGVSHIDDLGPDPLRGRDKALSA